MYIYLLTFACSILGIVVSEKQHNKLLRNILVVVSLLLPSLLAGFRSINIGTDVLTYVKPLFDLALQSDSFVEFLNLPIYRTWRYLPVYTIEIGYLLLTYVVAKLFHSLIALNFIISLIIISLIYFGLVKMNQINSHISVPFGLMTFYLLFFNGSLNTIRQYLAFSIIFWGFSFIIKKKLWYYLMTVLIATLFHKTAFFSLILYVIYTLLTSKKHIKLNDEGTISFYFRNFVFIGILMILCIFIIDPHIFDSIFQYLDLDGYMSSYLGGEYTFSTSYFLLTVPIIILIILNIKYLWNNNVARFFIFLYFSYAIFTQLASYSSYAIRIADIFSIYSIYSLSLFTYFQDNKKNIILKVILLLYLLMYWYIFYVKLHSGQTIPYISVFN